MISFFKFVLMKFSLGKQEKLKSRKLIQQLFEEGSQLKTFPLKLLYLQTEHTSDFKVQAAFSVPKKNFKKAVSRNRIKRLMREVYRKEKPLFCMTLNKPHIFMFIFMGDKEPNYNLLETKMKQLFVQFQNKISTDEKI